VCVTNFPSSSLLKKDEKSVALRHRVRLSHVLHALEKERVLREEKLRGRVDPFSNQRGGFFHRVPDVCVRVREAAEEDFEGRDESSAVERTRGDGRGR